MDPRSLGESSRNEEEPIQRALHGTIPSTSGSPSSPAQTIFEDVLEILKEYEIARHESMTHPRDEVKRAAFLHAAEDLESVWYHYSAGHLTREACLLVDFFINFLLWEGNVTVHPSAASLTNPDIPHPRGPITTPGFPDAYRSVPSPRLHFPGLTA